MAAESHPCSRHTFIVVMGVCGCGKSDIGRRLAERLGVRFLEGDQFHPPANIAKMSAGQPLDDADREPWLAAMADAIRAAVNDSEPGLVLACSALKRRYRDRLRQGYGELFFIYLHGERELLAQRMANRRDHYMPVSLLDSQLATLEPPASDEAHCKVSIAPPKEATADAAYACLINN